MRTHRLLALPLLLAVPIAAHADAKVCKAGALIYGNPTYKGTDKPDPKGQTVKQDPPLEWREFTIGKGQVFMVSGLAQELWGGDLNGQIKRIAGEVQAGQGKFADGPCASAYFATLWGLATLRDGSVVVADHGGRAVRVVSDPLGAGCKVTTVVGPNAPFGLADIKAPAAGDVDGAAANAKLGAPGWPVVDSSGNIYFIDTAYGKVKVIAADAARTVTTLGTLTGSDKVFAYTGMTMLDDKLYAIGNSANNSMIWEIDPETKKVKTVKDASGKAFPPLQANAPSLSTIASDGNALLISGQGYIWRVSKDGKTITNIAGRGYGLDYPNGYNPAGVYPTKDLFLAFRTGDALTGGNSSYIVWNDNAIYWRGRYYGSYVLKIGCP